MKTVNLLAKCVPKEKMASYELLCCPFLSHQKKLDWSTVWISWAQIFVICACIQATKPPMWWLAGRYWLKLFCTATQVRWQLWFNNFMNHPVVKSFLPRHKIWPSDDCVDVGWYWYEKAQSCYQKVKYNGGDAQSARPCYHYPRYSTTTFLYI